MDPYDGQVIGQVCMDALSFVSEHIVTPRLLCATVHLIVEDDEGEVRVVSHSWPEREQP